MRLISILLNAMCWISILLAVACALQTMLVRYRLKGCPKLDPSDDPPFKKHRLLHAPGVHVDDKQIRAASAYMLSQKLDVLELIPRDLSTLGILLFAEMVDPIRAARDLFAKGYTVFHATMVSTDVYERAKVREEELADLRSYEALAIRLRRYASRTSAYGVATGLLVKRKDAGRIEHAIFCALTTPYKTFFAALYFIIVLLLIIGVAANPLWGALALVVYHLQPAAATIGTGLAPFDLWKNTILRVPLELLKFPALLRAVWISNKETPEKEALRKKYEILLAKRTESFFEPRQTECPLCRSTALVVVLRTPDMLLAKPGLFSLERCGSCGHIFQNPRLSIKGLDFYYKDFYEGANEEGINFLFGFSSKLYLSRARALMGIHTPIRWLDIGAGLGHFCAVAKSIWPNTQFDGLDMNETIEEAERAGWIDHGIRGQFPELAQTLKGRYDVLSMYHYFEHTRNPRADLRAAYTVLSEQGYLAIEMPNPESPLARILGKYWHPWFQPQHQHFFTQSNLEKLLKEAGFKVLSYDYVSPHQAADVWWVAYFILYRLAKPFYLYPWGPRPSWYRILRSWMVYCAGFWLMFVGIFIDALIASSMQKPRRSNNYRILAQKVGHA